MLSKERVFNSKTNVYRRGCGLSPVKQSGGVNPQGGGSLQPASPVVIRAEWTGTIVWDTANVLNPFPENCMQWTDLVVVNYAPPVGAHIVNGALYAGITSLARTDFMGVRPFSSGKARGGTDIFSATAGWDEHTANYTLKGKILLYIPTTLISTVSISAKLTWGANTFLSGVKVDNAFDYTGTYTLVQLSQPLYTTYSLLSTKTLLTYAYSVTALQSTSWFRREANSTDSDWINAAL